MIEDRSRCWNSDCLRSPLFVLNLVAPCRRMSQMGLQGLFSAMCWPGSSQPEDKGRAKAAKLLCLVAMLLWCVTQLYATSISPFQSFVIGSCRWSLPIAMNSAFNDAWPSHKEGHKDRLQHKQHAKYPGQLRSPRKVSMVFVASTQNRNIVRGTIENYKLESSRWVPAGLVVWGLSCLVRYIRLNLCKYDTKLSHQYCRCTR